MKQKILIALMLLALLPTLLIGYVMNYYSQMTIKNSKLEMLTSIADMMDFHISRYYGNLLAEINDKAQSGLLKELLENNGDLPETREDEIIAARGFILQKIDQPVIGGALIDTGGKIIVSDQPNDEGLMLNQTGLYRSIMAGKKSYLGFLTSDDNSQNIEVAVPVTGENGEILGIFKQVLTLDALIDYLDSFRLKQEYAFLIRKNGTAIVQKSSGISEVFYNEYQDKNTLDELLYDFKNGSLRETSGIVTFEMNGTKYTGAYKMTKKINCIAVVAVNQQQMIRDMVTAKEILFLLTAFIIIFSGLVGYFLGDSILSPIRIINGSMKRILDGDLTARCTYSGKDEYRNLSDNLNKIAENLQKNERELRMSARVDNLTHLPNRYALYEVLDILLYKHPNQAILLLNLDGFKLVNDNLGHDVGDQVLMEVGDVLRSLPQHVCYPARIGGDEFVVFVTNWTSVKYPEKIARKILKEIGSIQFIDEIHVDISTSIGIEYIDGDKIDKKKLIRHSDAAMQKAKNTGKNTYSVYDQNRDREL